MKNGLLVLRLAVFFLFGVQIEKCKLLNANLEMSESKWANEKVQEANCKLQIEKSNHDPVPAAYKAWRLSQKDSGMCDTQHYFIIVKLFPRIPCQNAI